MIKIVKKFVKIRYKDKRIFLVSNKIKGFFSEMYVRFAINGTIRDRCIAKGICCEISFV